MTSSTFLDELRWRGLHQTTDDTGLASHLATGLRSAYVGFDPTADSLTIGNFIPIKLLMHFQQAGHRPIAVLGGGTGLIGDPSGKSAERQLLTREQVESNVRSQRRIFERLLDFRRGASGQLGEQPRLAGHAELHRCAAGCRQALLGECHDPARLGARSSDAARAGHQLHRVQLHDPAGLRLPAPAPKPGRHRADGRQRSVGQYRERQRPDPPHQPTHPGAGAAGESFGLTAPLVTRSDGGKFGKSESGAIWLSADRTSPLRLLSVLAEHRR